MKLATSTGDFNGFVGSITDKIKCFKNTKFKNINLEQTGVIPEFFEESDYAYKKLAEDWGNASTYAGVKLVVAHAPCLHVPCKDDETYSKNVRAIRRSIENCHTLGINRIVVHACPRQDFTKQQFYDYNLKFYREFIDIMEKYNIIVMTENWDNAGTKFSTGKEIKEFIEEFNHPLFGVCWDTAHCNLDEKAREIGQYQNIKELNGKLKGLHISDNFGDFHHHTFPFAGFINFDSIMQGLIDVNYDGYFTFEASYTLLNEKNPYPKKPFIYNGEEVKKLLNPSIELKTQAVNLLYDVGKHILTTYNCFEE